MKPLSILPRPIVQVFLSPVMISRRARCGARPYQTGFSLIEIAMVLMIIGFALSMLMIPFGTMDTQRRVQETNRKIEVIKEALTGYAVSRSSAPYLPCPYEISGSHFAENAGVSKPDCEMDPNPNPIPTHYEGIVPWKELGLSKNDVLDAWGRPFRYRVLENAVGVDPSLLQSDPTPIVCTEPGVTDADKRIQIHRQPEGSPLPPRDCETSKVVAVIVSHGPNGRGAFYSGLVASSANEVQNANIGSRFFVIGTPTSEGSSAGEFDDIVGWLSSFGLCNRVKLADQSFDCERFL